ncbi:MAG: membrane protein required for colicin V production [Paracoccaceae bacterium]|jgi:membrane protein required for colicin V production
MEAFTLVDAGVAGIILISAVLAFSRGFVREVLSIAGWIVAAMVAFVFAPQAEPLVKEIPIAGDFLADSCELSILAAFFAVFAIALIVVSIFTPLFSSLVQKSALGGFDQGLGFLFGVLRGTVLVAVAFVLYDRIVPAGQGIEMIDNSRTAAIFEQSKDVIEKQIPTQAPEWIVQRYEQLTGSCTAVDAHNRDAILSGTTDA